MAENSLYPGPDEGNGTWLAKPVREVAGQRFACSVIRSHLVTPGEDLMQTLVPYFQGKVNRKDVVVIGEKVLAIAEGRAVLLNQVSPRWVARFLSRHVRQLGYGLGLRRPETMEMAIRQAGVPKILLAAAIGAMDRLVGRTGDFYRIAGRDVASIDGPGPTTIPPYNEYIVLAPLHGKEFADRLAKVLHVKVAVVDVNDVGAEVLAASDGVDIGLVRQLMRDNPMGQGAQRTPLAVLRPVPKRGAVTPWPLTEPVGGQGGMLTAVPGEGDGCLVMDGGDIPRGAVKSATTNSMPESPRT